MQAQFDNSFWPWRMAATLVGIFSLLTMIMATVGLYAVMAYHVSQRTREIGLRMALGATTVNILQSALRHGMALAVVGLTIGILVSLAATRALGSLLYGVTPTDPTTFAVVSLLLLGVTLLACYIPARRATKVDPMVALRYE
jgi:putative ABC transport system permease protein